MSKKTEFLSFRTTGECHDHLKAIQEKYDLPIGNIIHRMIESFAKDGDVDKAFKRIMK